MRRTLRPLAALAMVAVIVAGCSNAPAGRGSSNSTAATDEKAMRFAECMRDNGVSESRSMRSASRISALRSAVKGPVERAGDRPVVLDLRLAA